MAGLKAKSANLIGDFCRMPTFGGRIRDLPTRITMPGIPSYSGRIFLQLTSHLDTIGLEPNGEFHGMLNPPRKSLQVPSTHAGSYYSTTWLNSNGLEDLNST